MKNKIFISLLVVLSILACDRELLDLESLTEPVDATFYKNEQELELALTGVYSTLRIAANYVIPMPAAMDNSATDVGIVRGFGSSFEELGSGSHSPTTNVYRTAYSGHYRAIGRVNALLENMERAKDEVSQERYAEIQAQALVIRAWHYMYLTEVFGDVPFVLGTFNTIEEGLLPRTAKADIADQILEDLNTASNILPNTWTGANKGRVTKGAALALRARIALYNKRYDVAASSAKAVMDNEASMGYALHPNYGELFGLAGENSPEIILIMPFKDGFNVSNYNTAQGSRNRAGFSTMVPTQSMIDSYEAIDGKPIDESEVYDPKQPFANRDPRLHASIILPGTEWAGLIFESHPDSLDVRRTDGTVERRNADSRKVSWPAAFCGYLWKKYTIEEHQLINQRWSDKDFILIRLAEVLLIYAESKVELNQIDNSVLNALNRIRARAYGTDVSNPAAYPAITSVDQAELRKVIKRERKVELANEGFRLFDIRRWRIAEKVMPVTIYGRILDPSTATGVPQIDDDGFVSYAGIESQYDLNTDARFPNAQNRLFNPARDYLCPIPQQEIDTYAGHGVTLEQNPGY